MDKGRYRYRYRCRSSPATTARQPDQRVRQFSPTYTARASPGK